MKIPTFIINLKIREDRLKHIKNEFKGHDEFQVTIVEAIEHKFGNLGLWHTIRQIIEGADSLNSEFILICEDDHLFTSEYSAEKIFDIIIEAKNNLADVLFGGVSWFEDAVQISDNLFSVKKFSGTQFTIIFKKFYSKILDAKFGPQDITDGKIATLSDSIFFTNPFISVQKEFGYSDATKINHGTERVQSLFVRSSIRAKILSNIRKHYLTSYNVENIVSLINIVDYGIIPTYILNLPERADRKKHILKQFIDKPEFDIRVVEGIKHKVGAFGHWQSIRKIVQLAVENEDDVMIICEDDHEFTKHYNNKTLLKSIYLAHGLGCEYLSGGSGKFDLAVPISENIFWTNHCLSTQFIIIFKKFFKKILSASFDEKVVGDITLSNLSNSKMLITPAISLQKEIGISDVTALHNDEKGIVQDMFTLSQQRLDYMQLVFVTYNSGTMKSLL